MEVYEIQGGFSLNNLRKGVRATPVVKAHEVLIRIKAASVNYRDLLILKGIYNPNLPLPLIPLSDGSGEVVALGNDVSEFRLGDRVDLFRN